MAKPMILDAWGRPIQPGRLSGEVAAPTIGGARSPISGYPADGLTPVRLAQILRDADGGDAIRYLELAETIEERDAHYLGVIGTRRRSVAQLDISVEAASEDPKDEEIAQMVRDYVETDELQGAIFNLLDCLSKGYSMTEVDYQVSEGQYLPRLIWRDPRSFRFARNDLATPLLLGNAGEELPLEPGKFIFATIKAKSGLALRSGLARVAAWGWLFKAYTQRDWAIFTQTYGQPVRLGKFGAGATEADKATLFRAVANIGGDCAAIIPESMMIEFVESGNVGAAHQLYRERADWIDQQISKAVLGQTSTTDAVVGGLGSGKEHRAVQKDIETADARALAAILNRDLVKVWVQLEYGPQKAYPRLRIGRADEEDLAQLSTALAPMIDRGLEVDQAEIRDRFGLAEPKPGAKLLSRQAAPQAPEQGQSGPSAAAEGEGQPLASSIKRISGEIKRGKAAPGVVAAPQAEGPLAGLLSRPGEEDPAEVIAGRLEVEASPAMADMLGQIEAMLQAAGSFEEFRAMLLAGFPKLNPDALVAVMAKGMLLAHVQGRVDLEAQSG